VSGSQVLHKTVQRNFSRSAEQYAQYAIVQERVVERLVELLAPYLPAAGAILDVGCGTGMLARRLQPFCPNGALVLSDMAHGMTLHARRQLSEALALDSDGADLALRSGSFSLVCSTSAYQWISPLDKAFSEAWRVLIPGGVFAFALFGDGTLCELKHSYRQAHNDLGSPPPSHLQAFPTEDRVRNALGGSAWERAEVFSELEVEYHRDVPHLLRALKRIGAQNASEGRPSGLASRRLMNRMACCYEQRYGRAEGIPATYRVIYGLAVRK